MPHRAYEAVGIARQPSESAPEHFIGSTISVSIRRQKRAHTPLIRMADRADKPPIIERLAEVHKATTTPSSVSCAGKFHMVDESTQATIRKSENTDFAKGRALIVRPW